MSEKTNAQSLPEHETMDEITAHQSMMVGSIQDMLKKYFQCPVCGANLSFKHRTDFKQNLTEESARCPECEIRIRKVLHSLQ